jgi:TolA-binding protein
MRDKEIIPDISPSGQVRGEIMANLFRPLKTVLCKMLLCGVAVLVVAGCAVAHKPIDQPQPQQQPKPVDTKAQQQYYNLGLQQYSGENYGEAKETFQRVIEYGPNTPLGIKAQENLKKIERILQTLEEIESK